MSISHHIVAIIVSVIVLLCVYYVEYVLHMMPCSLCIYQRFPYLLLIFTAIVGMASANNYFKTYLVITCLAIIVAMYQAAIEQGILVMSSFCKPLLNINYNLSVDNFKQMLYSRQSVLCNKPTLTVFGLSMTWWNLAVNLLLGIFFVAKLIMHTSTHKNKKHA